MSFGGIVGKLLQSGMGGKSPSRSRLEHSVGGSGGGLDQLLGAFSGSGGGSGQGGAGGGAGGGLAGMARDFLGGKQAGGLTGAQTGGIGALVGAFLGGGSGAVKGALGGGAMAILGSLAITALRGQQGGQGAGTAGQMTGHEITGADGSALPVTDEEMAALDNPATERLVLRAMIAAAKADGQVDQTEMQRLVEQIDDGEASDAERRFVMDELSRPTDLQSLIDEVETPAVAAEIYAASILAINIDTEAERRHLRDLAHGLGLDSGTVQRLHKMTGAPAA